MIAKNLVICIAIIMSCCCAGIFGAVAHKHEKHTSKERLKDGMFIPRDSYHHKHEENHVEFDHEAIIGNVKEAQEFDSLPPEESKKRLLVLVKLMDRNGDQYVDRHELKSWILRSFMKLSEEEAADRFEEIDANADEKITWKEYMLEIYSMEDETHKKDVIEYDSYDEEEKMIRDDKEMFQVADLDQDGSLNLSEFTLFQNPEEHPQMLPVVMQQTMREKDKNKDGKIDFTEYLSGSAERKDQEWLELEKDRFDTDFDLNSDGVLTGNEILKWIVPSNDDVANDEVDHLFASTDDDHDDRLSYNEILNNHDTFVGSEATDFGDHLQNIHRLQDEL